ncbi:MAG TPA: hypothetical protein VK086_03800 [Ruania sp.]|nr:hypothetical protein [Ruania sp.]
MRKGALFAVAAISAAAVVTGFVLLRSDRPEGASYTHPTTTMDELAEVAQSRVLFAHQSVGRNILTGVPSVYADHGLPAPEFVELAEADDSDNLLHLQIGTNGDPLGKIEAFDTLLRNGLAESLDAAVLKFCYEDVPAGTNVHGLFTTYQHTLAALQRDFPNVEIVAATVPLNTDRTPVGTVKSWLGRGSKYGPKDNAVREEFNALIRAEYEGTHHLFDIAAIESTTASGERITGRHDDRLYYALNSEFASDSGHLNSTGAPVVAEGFLAALGESLSG